MLEALSYGLPVLASDIPANLEVGLSPDQYFPLGNIEALAKSITRLSQAQLDMKARETIRAWVTQRYDWYAIAKKTMALYAVCLNK